MGWRDLVLRFMDGQPFRRVLPASKGQVPSASALRRRLDTAKTARAAWSRRCPPAHHHVEGIGRALIHGCCSTNLLVPVHNYIPIRTGTWKIRSPLSQGIRENWCVTPLHSATLGRATVYTLAQAARQGQGCSPQVHAWHVFLITCACQPMAQQRS